MDPVDPLHVLVIGATGNQGGALARHLLDRGHRVRGMTRDPAKPAAKRLEEQGAEVVKGFLLDPGSVGAAAVGVDVAFLVTTPYGAAGPDGEVKQGKAAVDALGQAGVPHIVYASMANVDRETGIAHFDSKRRVEEHLIDMGMPFTVVAPAYFRENVLAPWCLYPNELRLPVPVERKVQNISLDEVGAFHAYAIEHHADLMGERIDIASDETTPVQMAQAIAAASGSDFRFQRIQYVDLQGHSGDLARMYEWFDRVGYRVDIAALKEQYPKMPWQSFGEWTRQQDWAEVLPAPVEEPGEPQEDAGPMTEEEGDQEE